MVPIMPNLTGITRPHRTSYASVPRSIKSSFVKTAKVRLPINQRIISLIINNRNKPSGSTSLANLIASDVEKSTLAGVMARIIAFGLDI